jgi:hypothetical protein
VAAGEWRVASGEWRVASGDRTRAASPLGEVRTGPWPRCSPDVTRFGSSAVAVGSGRGDPGRVAQDRHQGAPPPPPRRAHHSRTRRRSFQLIGSRSRAAFQTPVPTGLASATRDPRPSADQSGETFQGRKTDVQSPDLYGRLRRRETLARSSNASPTLLEIPY